LIVRTTRIGETTTLGRIGALVTQAQAERAPIVRTADRFARFFTPLILTLAVLTYLLTGRLTAAIAVLIVACPCALVLATPTAIIAGVAAGARRGLVIRGGARLEQAGRVDAVCFDKTGTLTLGAPQVTRIVPLAGQTAHAVLALAAAAERYSEHPLARAIVARAVTDGVAPAGEVADFRSWPGRGVGATVAGRSVAVGTAALLGDLGVAIDPTAAAAQAAVEQQGATAVFVAADRRVVGVLGVADTPRSGVREAIAALRAAGVRRIVMLTGDNPTVAAAVARAAGIDEVHAGLLPVE
jgi:P-type E1-E2 ATPase